MKSKLSIFVFCFWFLLLASCRKSELTYPVDTPASLNAICFDCALLKNNYADSLDSPTVLGGPIENPYLIPNMTTAYRNVYGRSPKNPLAISHLYVKFSPASYQQLDQLENQDIELFNYPLHLELVSEGDYYIAPGKNIEDIPDYYAVVENSFRFPPGISYTVLDKMYIPDNDPAWEDEAMRLSGNSRLGDEYPPGYYNTNNSKFERQIPGELNPQQNIPANCSHYPSGIIEVQKELTSDRNFSVIPEIKIVIRRLFKVQNVYTNSAGEFTATKYFKNKYTITAKFKNHYARIARMRPWAIHEQFFPIKINLGKWDNLDCHHKFLIQHPAGSGTISTSQWCAATAYNSIREYFSFCRDEHISAPPENLNILLSSKRGSGTGNTYMLNKILKSSDGANSTEVVASGALMIWTPAVGIAALLTAEAYKARGPDIKYGYGGDASYLTTDRYAELVFHELSHASHYTNVGNNWWIKFGLAELKNPGEGDYGACCTEYAPIIAVGESWAYFVGHYLADKQWKMKSTAFPEQGFIQDNRDVILFCSENELSSHIVFLESFNPHRNKDPNAWVPKGLLYDLYDPVGESCTGSTIRDSVAGFQPAQFFKALKQDVETMDEFRNTFLSQNMNSQRDQVIRLFRQYGYYDLFEQFGVK